MNFKRLVNHTLFFGQFSMKHTPTKTGTSTAIACYCSHHQSSSILGNMTFLSFFLSFFLSPRHAMTPLHVRPAGGRQLEQCGRKEGRNERLHTSYYCCCCAANAFYSRLHFPREKGLPDARVLAFYAEFNCSIFRAFCVSHARFARQIYYSLS
jgi:hypothetical protein